MMELGGYDHKFLDPPDELVCLVCHHIAKEANQVECCGKVFCQSCITEVNQRMGTCPNCRAKSPKIFSDVRGAREIKCLKVACENEGKGCDWSGTLQSYGETHKEECGFNEVKCPNSGCTEMVLKNFVYEHSTTICPRRKVKCVVCSQMVIYNRLQFHLFSVCPKVKIKCRNSSCSLQLFREEMEAHQCVCPKERISCPYSEAGCTAMILREDRQKHLLENIEHHATIASNTVLSLKKELSNVREKLEEAELSVVTICTVPPVTFKMTNYRQKKEMKNSWKSQHFYTHPGGYKMVLYVDVYSDADKGYLSVYCHLVSGPNDDHLDWPFSANNSITIQILNQSRDFKHFSVNTDWNGADEEVTQKPTKFRRQNAGWGRGTFISHAELEKESNSYMKNDCIYFRVSNVTITKSWLTCTAFHEPLKKMF